MTIYKLFMRYWTELLNRDTYEIGGLGITLIDPC